MIHGEVVVSFDKRRWTLDVDETESNSPPPPNCLWRETSHIETEIGLAEKLICTSTPLAQTSIIHETSVVDMMLIATWYERPLGTGRNPE